MISHFVGCLTIICDNAFLPTPAKQRCRNELKVGGAEHTSAEGASSVEGSSPGKFINIEPRKCHFRTIWARNLEFILIAKMS